MSRLSIATGHYINVYGNGNRDTYVIINEANDVNDHLLLKATTLIENILEDETKKETCWNDIQLKLEQIFPYGTHLIFRR